MLPILGERRTKATGNYEPVTFCGFNRALEILADDFAPYWDKAEAAACVEWTQYWGEMKSYLKHCGEW